VFFFFLPIRRYSDQPTADHGETSVGLVHSVQTGRPERRNRGGHLEKTVAGDNPRTRFAAVHHQRGIYSTHAVRTRSHNTI